MPTAISAVDQVMLTAISAVRVAAHHLFRAFPMPTHDGEQPDKASPLLHPQPDAQTILSSQDDWSFQASMLEQPQVPILDPTVNPNFPFPPKKPERHHLSPILSPTPIPFCLVKMIGSFKR